MWALGASAGAGPAIVVAQCVARASAAPLIFFYEYIVDDEDAKGEYYNWFGDSRRLLGMPRVVYAPAPRGAPRRNSAREDGRKSAEDSILAVLLLPSIGPGVAGGAFVFRPCIQRPH